MDSLACWQEMYNITLNEPGNVNQDYRQTKEGSNMNENADAEVSAID